MNTYRKIDMASWPRREHYKYYTERLKVEYSITTSIDITKLLDFCHANGYRFYPSMIYFVTKVVNEIENLRMFLDGDGSLCVWNRVIPSYTIFHEDDKTFSDCWSDYCEDFDTFYRTITEDMEKYKDVKGIKARKNQPPNFYCISCAPWTAFTSYTSRVPNGEPSYFPIITIGKYETDAGKTTAPVNLTIAHAVCDGYHSGLFFEKLQKSVNDIGKAVASGRK